MFLSKGWGMGGRCNAGIFTEIRDCYPPTIVGLHGSACGNVWKSTSEKNGLFWSGFRMRDWTVRPGCLICLILITVQNRLSRILSQSSFSPFLPNKVKTPLVEFLKQPRFEQGFGWDLVTITPSERYLFEANLLASLQNYSPKNVPWARMALSGIFVVIFKYAYLKVSKRETQRKQNLFFINDRRIRYSCDIIYKASFC